MRFGFSMRPRRGKIVPVPAAAGAAFPPASPLRGGRSAAGGSGGGHGRDDKASPFRAQVLPVRTVPAPGTSAPGRLDADGLEADVLGHMRSLSRNGRERLRAVARDLADHEHAGRIVCGIHVAAGTPNPPSPLVGEGRGEGSPRRQRWPGLHSIHDPRPLLVLAPLTVAAVLVVSLVAERRLGGLW